MILVTGGLGYIGSHMAAILLANGHDVILVDNLCNSKMDVLERLEYLAGRYVTFMRLDIRNTPALQRTIQQYGVTAIVHCAGNKSIPDSAIHPLDFYNNNLTCTTSILRAMQRSGVKTLLYASSLAIYGSGQADALSEDAPQTPLNPYVKSLHMSEQIISDVVTADSEWRVAIARYGNVAGAYPGGILGEFNHPSHANLMPALIKAARQDTECFEIQGLQHDTPDGTAIRDYIHVMDVAEANMHLLGWLFNQLQALEVFNIASGTGTSVQAFLKRFTAVTQQEISAQPAAARPGDAACLIANVSKARQQLNWQATRTVDQMISDAWFFDQQLAKKSP